MKVIYNVVTFVASLLIIAFVSWEGYMQWPAIEATAKQVFTSQQHAKQCECGPACPKGGCADCACKQCCPGH